MPTAPATSRKESPVLSLRGVGKRFGAVVALADVDLDTNAGEVHAVLGENGAGKSTLMRIIYGLVRPDSGTVTVDGTTVAFDSPLAARAAGIGMVHQEFALVDALSVAENLALNLSPPGRFRWRRSEVKQAAARLTAEIGLALGDLDARVAELPVGLRQRIEIVKALANRTRVLILDEPTAVLTPAEVDQLFTILEQMRRAGSAILFITHKLAEVTRLADRVTVLRAGRVVARARRGDLDGAGLASAMVGALPATTSPAAVPEAAPVRLVLDAVSLRDRDSRLLLDSVSLQVRGGELLGIAGVDGNGQAELFELLAGLRAPAAGQVVIDGVAALRHDPGARLAAGVATIPPDRQRLGVVAPMSIEENAVLNARLLRGANGRLITAAARQALARSIVERYAIRSAGLRAPAASLSGGNLQKLIVGRAMAVEPGVLVAANPTRGLDVAAAQAVYETLDDALRRGAAVVLISTELDEIVSRCHRLAVLSRGRLSEVLERPFHAEDVGTLIGGSPLP